ncbi:MAG: TetR/AcrR family transcriptional regulator [Sphingomonadales bacterium]|nr:MAG: TetR/AcrR family transcriptional regulator [Sphingomonadales bacterium]
MSTQTAVLAPTTPPTGQRNTRRRILDAASRCFDRDSIRHTSMEEVARESGMSRQTIYRHFQAKEELVAAVSVLKAEAVTDLVRERIADDRDSRSKIVTAIVACVERLVTDRQMREMIEGEYKQLMQRAERPDVVATVRERWTPILKPAVADGTLRGDVDIDVMISWLTDIEMLLAMRVIVFGQSLEETRQETELFVMNGICRA